MLKTKSFSKRIGAVKIPEATAILKQENEFDAIGGIQDAFKIEPPTFTPPVMWPEYLPRYRFCSTVLREGCYTLTFRPKNSWWFGPIYKGTMRVEKIDGGYRISSDLYRRYLWRVLPGNFQFELEDDLGPEDDFRKYLTVDDATDMDNVIPIYSRGSYHSYLEGTGASLLAFVPISSKCRFTLRFDEFKYQHPASGFSGSFPNSPDRAVRFEFNHTSAVDMYSGKAYEGATEIGTVSMKWVSPYFRRADLDIHTLTGADAPQGVNDRGGVEDFRTIFATAGWDLKVNYAGTINLPASLTGVQNPNTCWASQNSHRLMESIPGYNPAILDTVWKARLLAIPARLGCSRGLMFDNGAGDRNNVPREGAVTHSHDGFPASDGCGSNYGVAENDTMRNHPRAFLRSAAHEVGHTFNQIHQHFETGNDNSIMTVTPCVSGVIDAAAGRFPNDIDLSFNATVRRHLIHLPDPAVRPGGMDFFGAAVNAPEADQVAWPNNVKLELNVSKKSVCLGEVLPVTWKLTNIGQEAVMVPKKLDCESMTARVSVADPSGKITFIRPYNLEVCSNVEIQSLSPKKSVKGNANVFWGKDGFAFEQPGRHIVEVIVLWYVKGVQFGTCGETEIWVEFPTDRVDNQVAAQLMDEEIGKAVASGNLSNFENAKKKIEEAYEISERHPACASIKKLGLD